MSRMRLKRFLVEINTHDDDNLSINMNLIKII